MDTTISSVHLYFYKQNNLYINYSIAHPKLIKLKPDINIKKEIIQPSAIAKAPTLNIANMPNKTARIPTVRTNPQALLPICFNDIEFAIFNIPIAINHIMQNQNMKRSNDNCMKELDNTNIPNIKVSIPEVKSHPVTFPSLCLEK